MRGSAVARAERVKRGWSSADAVPPSEKVALTWPTAKYAIARSPTIDDTACESTHHLIVDVTRCDTVAAAGHRSARSRRCSVRPYEERNGK
jgi:hypothetical protein